MSEPVRIGGRLHPLGVVVLAWQWGRYALYGGALSAIASGSLAVVLPIVAIGAAIAIPLAILAWRRFSYRLDGDRLIVERGVLVRQERVVPLDRIRGVDISAPPLHRILGLVQVAVDAAGAGGGASELDLAAVSRAQAEELRRGVLRTAPGRDRPADEARSAPTIARVGYGTLALAGATSTRWLVAPLVAVAALANIVFRDESAQRRVFERVEAALPDSTLAIGLIGVAVLVAAVLVAAIGSVIVDGDFRLSRDGMRLTAERGLLRRRSVSIDRSRISALEFRDTPLWRLVGLTSLRALVAGVGSGDGEARGRTSLLPAGQPRGVRRLARGIDPRLSDHFLAHPRAARTRRIIRAVGPPLVLLPIAWALGGVLLAALAALAALIAVPLALDRYRALGHGLRNGRLNLSGGSLSRHRTSIDPATVAGYHLTSTPFQRRVGVCTLTARMGRGAGSRSALDIGEGQAAALLAATEPRLFAEFTTSTPQVSPRA